MPPRCRAIQAHSYVLTGESQLTAGDLVFDVASDTWAWSDEVYRIHGFAPGDVVPSTRLLLAHVHPDDRGRFATMLDGVGADGQPIMSHHRLVDAKAGVRYVVLALRGRFTVQDTGQDELPSTPVGLSGYLIDLTAVREKESRDIADEAVARSAAHRASIEQAKGMLMAHYGVDAERAFEKLAAISQHHNVKVWVIAERLMTEQINAPGFAARLIDEADAGPSSAAPESAMATDTDTAAAVLEVGHP